MNNMESKLKTVPFFRCENETVPVCQRCETCILARKIFSTKEWFRRVSDIAQRRFLVSILGQLDSLYLLHYFLTLLQTIQGKDFIYNRSRVDLSKREEDIMKFSVSQILDKTVEQNMKEILCWFRNSTHRTKANYTLLLLQMCGPKLLLIAANVIRVLFQKEHDTILELGQDPSLILLFPEKYYNLQLDTIRVRSTSFPLSKDSEGKSLLKNVEWETSHTEGQWTNSLQCISEMNKLYSKKAHMLKAGYIPSNLLVDQDVVRDLSSGACKYRDFIRQLPIHLSKYILSMLDKNTLSRCASVSQHWAVLAKKVKKDYSMHAFIHNQIALLQGSYTKGIDPTYACKVFVPVPKMTDDIKRIRVKNQKWKLKTKNDNNLWMAYQNQETQQIQMEERNVFCGSYNIHILSDTWDRNRIIHYSGGDVVAVSSNRKIQLLDVLRAKEIPVQFRGHTGSIRALFLCEAENFLLSGSYDLSIREVLHVALLFLRVISACADGKIRIYNFLNGNCLKVMKANGRGDPVLSFFIDSNRMVINTESQILTFQFENIKWQYFQERTKQRKYKDKEDREDNLLEVISKTSTPIPNVGSSMSSKYVVAQESTISKSQRSRIQLKGTRTPLAESLESPQSQVKVKSPRRDGDSKIKVSPVSKEAISLDGVQESLEAKPLTGDDTERVPKKGQLETSGYLPKQSIKKSWKISMSPDRFLLTVNALQQAHNSGKYAYPHRVQSEVIDVWEPSISHPRKVIGFKGKSLQHAVDRLRAIHPSTDVKETSISLEIQKLQPNLKNSLHHSQIQSTIPQPMIIRSSLGEDQVASSIGRAVHSFRPLTSRHVIKANRMLAPQVGKTTQPVKKERPCYCMALDPFRMNSDFMLLTVREEKEYEEAKLKEYQATKPTGVVNPEKARKAAWIRKIKGLPIDNFMKHGKTAAPELGPNVFI
ncbi:CMT1A duplicated region transcript 1 protein isoform X4 [Pipistrellus kuhlii]|uniref:CMT1A duplicated region transcript 1 protein isoform X4 n=1 Tax=Pipistrellus kuhlii TaxID=59472 RepID=UPI001E2706EC|nr:CMT1A duplicated region transcript 1 protein isoform X4 [Pipistrellus kuhlii]